MSLQSDSTANFPSLIKVNITQNSGNRKVIVDTAGITHSQLDILLATADQKKASTSLANETQTNAIVDKPDKQLTSEKTLKRRKRRKRNVKNVNKPAFEIPSAKVNSKLSAQTIERIKFKLPAFVLGSRKAVTIPEKPNEERLGIESIFPNVCFHFLQNECIYDNCLDSHTYPENEEVYTKLCGLGPAKSIQLFNVIVARCPNLHRYCETFVEYFAVNKQTNQLIKMIDFCEDPNNYMLILFQNIIKAFIQSGLSYKETIKTILKQHKRISRASLTIIFNWRAIENATISGLIEAIDSLSSDRDFEFDPAIMNRLLDISIQVKNVKLIETTVKIFNHLMSHSKTFRLQLIDQNLFCEFFKVYEKCSSDSNVEFSAFGNFRRN